MNRESCFMTKDIGQAAALLGMNQKLSEVIREGSTCFFVFLDKEKCEEISNQYTFGDLLINAREFQESLIRLKSVIFRG